MNIKGKTIILITPKYYGYEEYIKKSIEDQGAKVFMIYENLDEINYLYRFFYVYFKNSKKRICKWYYRRKLNNAIHLADIVLVIRGASVVPAVMEDMKVHAPSECKFILYQWDGVKNNPNALKIANYFDSVSTFDIEDAKIYGWKYRPLFYIDSLIQKKHECLTDMIYICSLHSKRMAIFRSIKVFAEKKHLSIKTHIYVKRLVYLKRKYLNRNPDYKLANRGEVSFATLPIEESYRLFNGSRVAIDYTHIDQTGYTMRTIECVGNRCKIVTNNHNIRKADFYSPKNVFIYDENKFEIPDDFLLSGYEEIPSEIYEYYSLSKWTNDVLGIG